MANAGGKSRDTGSLEPAPGTAESGFAEIWENCAAFTMTSRERALALFRATRYIVERNVPGSFVECGVWRGGSSMIAMKTLMQIGGADREFFLFDTFDGMTPPSDDFDVDFRGHKASDLLRKEDKRDSQLWAVSPLEEVQKNIALTGYDPERVHFVQGDVSKVLAKTRTGVIALLRLDTDFYESTLAELQHLYPRLIQHGVLLIDDYGHWQGCRRAVDQYFAAAPTPDRAKPTRPFLHTIDYTGRIAVRSEANPPLRAERYDYTPRGVRDLGLLEHFPSLVPTSPANSSWPHLRRDVPHIWRTDLRSQKPGIGVLSAEEANVLAHLASQFDGKRGLEIGCHFGWSTAHIASAGLRLDVVDPALADPTHQNHVREPLEAISAADVRLWAGFSPSIIAAVASVESEKWSFVLIDGNHDGDAPYRDACAVLPHCAKSAMIVFHDLASPAV